MSPVVYDALQPTLMLTNNQGRLLLQGNKNDSTIIGKHQLHEMGGERVGGVAVVRTKASGISITAEQDQQATEQQQTLAPFDL